MIGTHICIKYTILFLVISVILGHVEIQLFLTNPTQFDLGVVKDTNTFCVSTFKKTWLKVLTLIEPALLPV